MPTTHHASLGTQQDSPPPGHLSLTTNVARPSPPPPLPFYSIFPTRLPSPIPLHMSLLSFPPMRCPFMPYMCAPSIYFPLPSLYTPSHSMEKQPHSARHHLLPDVRIHSSPTPTYPYTHPSPRPLFPRRNHHFVFVIHHAPPIYMIHSHPAHYPLPGRRSTPTHHLIYRVLHTTHYLSFIPQHSSPSHAQHYAPNHTLWPTVTHHAPIHSLTVTHH